MDTARYSNFVTASSDPDNVKGASKGKNGIYVLASGRNEPNGQESVGGKVTRVMIENYMRRPSLKEEALKKMTEFAHDAVCIQQSPAYQVECDLGILLLHGDSFRWMCAGDVRVFHFVNGQIVHASGTASVPLGRGGEKTLPDLLQETRFEKGENSFLLCSGSLLAYLKEAELENLLAMSENAEEWLRAIRDLYEDRCQGEPYALMTLFMPEKRKRMPKKTAVIIAVAAVVLLVGAFFALGALRRRNGGPGGPGGPGGQRPPLPQGGPGMEPTEPPAPPEGMGAPGEKPTAPPKPTEPPAPEGPEAPEGAEGQEL